MNDNQEHARQVEEEAIAQLQPKDKLVGSFVVIPLKQVELLTKLPSIHAAITAAELASKMSGQPMAVLLLAGDSRELNK